MNTLTVFNYHGIESSDRPYSWEKVEKPYVLNQQAFESQLRSLKHFGASCLSLDELSLWFEDEIKTSLPILLTFDDGHISHFEQAAPILKKECYPATFFVSVGLIGKPNMMTLKHLQELVKQGCAIGVHGYHHKPLTQLNKQGLEIEIVEAKMDLENQLGSSVRAFSVPLGYYDERLRRYFEKAGYEYVFTSDYETNTQESDPLHLNRIVVKANTTLMRFERCLRGQLGFKKYTEQFKARLRRQMPPAWYDRLAALKRRFA